MICDEIKNLVEKAVKNLYQTEADFNIDRPSDAVFGDYSTNVAMTLHKNPQEIADAIKPACNASQAKRSNAGRSDILEKVEVKNGFINFFISKEYLQQEVENILKQKEKYGDLKIGNGQKVHPVKSHRWWGRKAAFNKVNVEFISANPTGPLTLANGRGGFCGDVLTNILNRAGYKAEREYYVNDTGEQVIKLGHSIIGDSEAVYKGKYIEELHARIKGDNPNEVGEKGAKIILEEMIKPSVKKMGIEFDVWFSEKSLYQKNPARIATQSVVGGEVDKILEFLKKKNLTYEKEGALWFKSTEFGDDKDRVLIKEDGEKTYLASDIAYLKNKINRGFKRLILFLGSDHHGYQGRLKAAVEVLGFGKENMDIIIMQLVKLFDGAQEVKMSKRTGLYITIDELVDEVGLDVTRFFFLMRDSNGHLNFDMQLAKEQSQKNPVYYVQYAYARICSIIRKSGKSQFPIFNFQSNSNFQLLKHESELNLIKKLIQFPEIIKDTAKDYQVQRLPQYAMDLAAAFHKFYQECQVISDNKELTRARLALISATKIVLKKTLSLMGISAPEKM